MAMVLAKFAVACHQGAGIAIGPGCRFQRINRVGAACIFTVMQERCRGSRQLPQGSNLPLNNGRVGKAVGKVVGDIVGDIVGTAAIVIVVTVALSRRYQVPGGASFAGYWGDK
ncbi:hypothetical protein FKG94_23545 [Exilibacterium tricleocarpae]|uniref:Uncharacterized protein n=1 Tax=Exilibacterium tricleocarpae TaxID=2591008 RepID=A0A545STH2_9GAMM|nr:hypothetical protein [Exilibacterium tricleocarpae]TQV68270.1 hypothetical protein FKG94_23545 [Exilibacterium tricleocarpae]